MYEWFFGHFLWHWSAVSHHRKSQIAKKKKKKSKRRPEMWRSDAIIQRGAPVREHKTPEICLWTNSLKSDETATRSFMSFSTFHGDLCLYQKQHHKERFFFFKLKPDTSSQWPWFSLQCALTRFPPLSALSSNSLWIVSGGPAGKTPCPSWFSHLLEHSPVFTPSIY